MLLASLGALGPFAIDTYLPAFAGIAASLEATPVQMQQTLSSYLFGFAAMNLFHGALADSFGRRPVVLWGVGLFTLASIGCVLSQSIGWLIASRTVQGLAAGAGMVVSRAIIRDLFEPADAQRVMSQVTIFFGVAPAVVERLISYVGAALQTSTWQGLRHSVQGLLARVRATSLRSRQSSYFGALMQTEIHGSESGQPAGPPRRAANSVPNRGPLSSVMRISA